MTKPWFSLQINVVAFPSIVVLYELLTQQGILELVGVAVEDLLQ